MYCTNCGNKRDKEANYCQNCGRKLKADVSAVANNPQQQQAAPLLGGFLFGMGGDGFDFLGGGDFGGFGDC
jgi:hypothetical protein